jgi:hypothetical protein
MANRIVKIGVAGYKSAMSPIAVNLRDITVLAGPNSAGKSTVIQPLLMIKQTLEKPFDPGGLAIDGPLVRFTRAEQFLSGEAGEDGTRALEIAVDDDDGGLGIVFRPAEAGGLVPVAMSFARNGRSHEWRDGQILSATDLDSLVPISAESAEALARARFRVGRLFCWLAVGSIESEAPVRISHGFAPVASSIWRVEHLIHLPGLRGVAMRHYPQTAIGPRFPGDFPPYVASIIHAWERQQDPRVRKLGNDLLRLGLTSRLTAVRLDDTRIELQVARLPDETSEMVNIADVGLGVGQVLPVLVALHAAERDRIVHIEQPELHLHPRAQVELAGILLDAADRGVQVVIETHSSLLLLALQTLVAEGKLKPDRLSLNWFSRDAQGQTQIKQAEVTPDGAYGDWPEDFGDVELQLQSRYLDVASHVHAAAAE